LFNQNQLFKRFQKIVYAILISSVLGILIEIIQEEIITSRSFSWWDIAANFSGIFISTWIIARISKNNKNQLLKKIKPIISENFP
jgi:VanZ family protein